MFANRNMNGNSQTPTSHVTGHTNGSSNGSAETVSKKAKLVDPKSELEEFDKVFKVLMTECLNEGGAASKDTEIGDAVTHFLRVCEFLIITLIN